MNKSKLKSYAPQARKDFIAMVTGRAAQLGLSEVKGELQIEDCLVQGEVAVIGGQAFPARVAQQRNKLIERLRREGFAHTMDAVAYTWFNRFAALRYLELHNYLSHGQRVLSSVSEGGLPDVLTHALELVEGGELPGIESKEVAELKLASKDGELYKRLLVAQCNALSSAMPFLFEKIDDETELLLPDNLLRTDSVIRKLVESIDEADWDQVEIIGWLYQFYISEKKDEVIGKVVKSEDIPAATQLFTPNWIVKYLVQNSAGRLWLQANPASTLAGQWAYYIQPAEQTPEVKAQLDALIQTRIAEDGDTLNPESITVLDPACGSGHILVEAYDLLKAIYLERGYRERDIPRLILQKNLFGLDIDDRAAQLAGFALLMKARADDRRLFNDPIQLNIHALQESHSLDIATLADTVLNAAIQIEGGEAIPSGQLFGGAELATQHSSGLAASDLRQLLKFFDQAKNFGSLLTVPADLAAKLPKLADLLDVVIAKGDALAQSYATQIQQDYLQPAQMLAKQYDAVVANPPYMGSKGMNAAVKDFAKSQFPDSKSDLFAMFIERGFGWCKPSGFNSMVTMQSWMFLSSYESMREKLLANRTIITMAHLGARAFGEISGEVVQTTAFVLEANHFKGFNPVFFRLVDGNEPEKKHSLLHRLNVFNRIPQDDFIKIPGSPVAYWADGKIIDSFSENKKIEDFCHSFQGVITGDNEKFVRQWFELSYSSISWEIGNYKEAEGIQTWIPYGKGGSFRKWYGNNEHALRWNGYGDDLTRGRTENRDWFFKECLSWSDIASSRPSFRLQPKGILFDAKAPSAFFEELNHYGALGLLNSKFVEIVAPFLNPTLSFQIEAFYKIPLKTYVFGDGFSGLVKKCVQTSKADWDSHENSWDFQTNSITSTSSRNLEESFSLWVSHKEMAISSLRVLEERINIEVFDAFGLNHKFSPEVPEDQITLTRADRQKDMQRLISYAIGCMMGRYSLDESGLIYAHAGNVGFDASRYIKFPADADGIVPLTDLPWFPDDAARRITEFLVAVWGEPTRDENLAWLAESLGQKADETPEETIRRYLSASFFKDHCQTYKKRPIYWLFSSGKQKAFEALVYLHRYNESTLARLRAEYVVPLTGKMAERIRLLEDDAIKASSTTRKKIDKDIDKLRKKLEELRQYDEKLRHFADQRITLDLDDGVKVNYAKFGDLLDGVKAITGGSGDD
jgi:type II restriction/modification system DNA methylase subunit YeeA